MTFKIEVGRFLTKEEAANYAIGLARRMANSHFPDMMIRIRDNDPNDPWEDSGES